MTTAIVIPVDAAEPIRLEQFVEHDLDAYRRLVDGNLDVLDLNRPPASMYFNEEGKCLAMPMNHRATALLWIHNSAFRGRDVVVGPAFIVGPPDHQGNDHPAPQDLIDLLLSTTPCSVQIQPYGDGRWYGNGLIFADWFDAYLYGVHLAQRWITVGELRVIPELDDELLDVWYELGMSNPQITAADEPPFTRESFIGSYSAEELAEHIAGTTWAVGTALHYRDLCFIQQVDGGDEWLTIRHGIAFASLTLIPHIEDGTFASLVYRLLAASKEQCQQREY